MDAGASQTGHPDAGASARDASLRNEANSAAPNEVSPTGNTAEGGCATRTTRPPQPVTAAAPNACDAPEQAKAGDGCGTKAGDALEPANEGGCATQT